MSSDIILESRPHYVQLVRVVSKEVGDDNWWRGEVGGITGLFPHCFVEREKYRVIHNYQAQNSDEISLQKGQVISSVQSSGL